MKAFEKGSIPILRHLVQGEEKVKFLIVEPLNKSVLDIKYLNDTSRGRTKSNYRR